MKIHDIPIVIIVLTLITISLTAYITDMADQYGVTADTETISKLDAQFEVMKNESEKLEGTIKDFIPEETDTGFELPYTFLRLGWQTIKTFFTAVLTLGGIIPILGNVLAEVGVPMAKEVLTAIVTIMYFIVIAIVGYGLYKWKFES